MPRFIGPALVVHTEAGKTLATQIESGRVQSSQTNLSASDEVKSGVMQCEPGEVRACEREGAVDKFSRLLFKS